MANENRDALRLCVGLMLGLWLIVPDATSFAGSIFDDDYVPRHRVEPLKPEASSPAAETEPTPPSVNPPAEQPTTDISPAPTAGEARLPTPTSAEQGPARKRFKSAFADQLKDKSAAGRRRLAKVLLSEAAKPSITPVDQFVLLSGAVQSGEEAASLMLSFDGVDALAKSFVIDSLSAKAAVATKVWSSVTPATATVGNVQRTLDLIDALVTEDDFITASKVEAALQKGMGSIRDADLKATAANFVRGFEAAHSERENLRASFEVLKRLPLTPLRIQR